MSNKSRAEKQRKRQATLLAQATTFATRNVGAGQTVMAKDLVASSGISPEEADQCLVKLATAGAGVLRIYQRRGAVLCPNGWTA